MTPEQKERLRALGEANRVITVVLDRIERGEIDEREGLVRLVEHLNSLNQILLEAAKGCCAATRDRQKERP